MKYFRIKRNSLTCIVVILIVAIFTCGFFEITSLIASKQNNNMHSNNDESTHVSKTSTPVPSATFSPSKTSTPISSKSFNPAATNTLCPSWKNVRNDIQGNRNDVWKLLYENKPNNKINWNEFKDQVVVCNPKLKNDGYVFIKGNTYILP